MIDMPQASKKRLNEIWDALGEDERQVLFSIARRLEKGRQQYGELVMSLDPRNWEREAHEEYLDATVYLAIRMLRDGAKSQ